MSARRDPRGRRRSIVEAAAELIAESGVSGLTHRGVAARARVPLGATTYYFATLDDLSTAALQHLAQDTDEALRELAGQIARDRGDPAAVAALLHDYLRQGPRVRADAELYLAGVHRPDLRPLTLRWFEGLVRILAEHTTPRAARALALYVDGAMLHALTHDEPLDPDELAFAVTSLMGRTATTDTEL
ncbi:TetR/AcrR family transcriptional regulator [Nocardiopsis sp. NPDC101807]|uniref:TetR/AcrR family transcriptional regulator n=1 Tax=Nocardiopsis sp. NPDC101807 TaxID=3364339 RepID=UPI00382471DE